MAFIAHRDAETYLAKRNRCHFLFLVFGSDQGLVVERSRKLLSHGSEGYAGALSAIDFSGDSIASDAGVLIDEIHSIGLFDDKPRPIRIDLGSRSIIPALEMVLASPPIDRTIIVQAGELKRDAPIRKWFEKQDVAAAIECLADQARDIEGLLEAEFASAKIDIEPDARDLLLARLGEDRLLTRSEVEKILLYVRGRRAIATEDVADILSGGTPIDIDTLITDCFSGRIAQVVDSANTQSFQPGDYPWLAAAVLRYALSIHRARSDLEAGAAFDAVHQTLLRLVGGYSRKSETANQLKKISAGKAATAINAIYVTIKKSRQNGFLNEDQLFRLLIAIAQTLRDTPPPR